MTLDKYIRYPKTVHQTVVEIRKILNDYWTGLLPEEEAKEYIRHYAKKGLLLSDGGKSINPTLRNQLGKKKINLINEFLGNYQLTFVEKLR